MIIKTRADPLFSWKHDLSSFGFALHIHVFVWKVQVFKSRSMSRFLDYTAQQKSWSTLISSGITKWVSTRALPAKAELVHLAYLLGLQAAGSMWRCPCCTLLNILGSSNSVIEGLDLLVQEGSWFCQSSSAWTSGKSFPTLSHPTYWRVSSYSWK